MFDASGIEVVKIVENEDGSALLMLNISEELKKEFMDNNNLKRWSSKRFESFIVSELESHIEKLKESKDIERIVEDSEFDRGGKFS